MTSSMTVSCFKMSFPSCGLYFHIVWYILYSRILMYSNISIFFYCWYFSVFHLGNFPSFQDLCFCSLLKLLNFPLYCRMCNQLKKRPLSIVWGRDVTLFYVDIQLSFLDDVPFSYLFELWDVLVITLSRPVLYCNPYCWGWNSSKWDFNLPCPKLYFRFWH